MNDFENQNPFWPPEDSQKYAVFLEETHSDGALSFAQRKLSYARTFQNDEDVKFWESVIRILHSKPAAVRALIKKMEGGYRPPRKRVDTPETHLKHPPPLYRILL